MKFDNASIETLNSSTKISTTDTSINKIIEESDDDTSRFSNNDFSYSKSMTVCYNQFDAVSNEFEKFVFEAVLTIVQIVEKLINEND